MSYRSVILKDSPIGYWTLSETSGSSVIDHSGCGNNGQYINNPVSVKIPLVSGEDNFCKEITNSKYITLDVSKNYSQTTLDYPGFANANSSDNDFSLEFWIYPKIESTNETVVLGDPDNNIGIFWQNNNIIFKLDSQTLEYSITELNKAIHVVATYTLNYIYIYINGTNQVYKKIDNFKFTNTSLNLQVGPTGDSNDYFIVDDIAIYRYALNEKQVYKHYSYVGYMLPNQVSVPDNGEIFDFIDTGISKVFEYSYPINRPWELFLNTDVILNRVENYIELAKTETSEYKEFIIEDIITIPSGITMDSSKIEWVGENGVKVETSIDGTAYTVCSNGDTIPQYTLSNFNDQKIIYIKITLSSDDASRYCPRLYKLSLSFYNQQILYSKNGTSYLSKISDCDFILGSNKSSILHRDQKSGVFSPSGSGFILNIDHEIKAIEFFYTPKDITAGSLIRNLSGTEYCWNQIGSINKSNIASIYVNGINQTTQTDISNIFKKDYLYHVVINLTDPISEELIINHSSPGACPAVYQYLSIYEQILDFNKINNHFNMYIGTNKVTLPAVSMSMTESSINLYNNDWIVIQNS